MSMSLLVNGSDLLFWFRTNGTKIYIYDRDIKINSEKLYVIISEHNDGQVNIRFGNTIQTRSILKTFKYSVAKEHEKDYLKFLKQF